jgi:ethanolamine permease
MGARGGFLAGMAQNIEFLLAPPAIAAGIGAYVSLFVPALPPLAIAVVVYILFTILNILGTNVAAKFELFVTVIAVVGLILFSIITLPNFSTEAFTTNALPNGWGGVFAAIPFAIWFFLGIEGLANVAEESVNPQRDLTRGFLLAMATLVLLCAFTFVAAVGVSGWEGVVFDEAGLASDSPLPLALQKIGTEKHPLYSLIIGFGVFGLVASFHGLLLAAGRSTYEFCRLGNGPAWLGKQSRQTNSVYFHTGRCLHRSAGTADRQRRRAVAGVVAMAISPHPARRGQLLHGYRTHRVRLGYRVVGESDYIAGGRHRIDDSDLRHHPHPTD